MPRMKNSKARHSSSELTREDIHFAGFLARQKIAPATKRASRYSMGDIKPRLRAILLIRRTVEHTLWADNERAEIERVLDRLTEKLPQRMRAGIKYAKMGVRRGHPIPDARKYFLLAALYCYARAVKGRGAWRWVDQMLAEIGLESVSRPEEIWRRSIQKRMVGDMRPGALPATTIKDAETESIILHSTNSSEFDALMETGACAHLMFTMCRTKELAPHTPIRGRVSDEMDDALNSDSIGASEEKILRQAVLLMPALRGPYDNDMLAPSAVWGMEWVA